MHAHISLYPEFIFAGLKGAWTQALFYCSLPTQLPPWGLQNSVHSILKQVSSNFHLLGFRNNFKRNDIFMMSYPLWAHSQEGRTRTPKIQWNLLSLWTIWGFREVRASFTSTSLTGRSRLIMWLLWEAASQVSLMTLSNQPSNLNLFSLEEFEGPRPPAEEYHQDQGGLPWERQ